MKNAAPRSYDELWNLSVIAVTAALAVTTGSLTVPHEEGPRAPPTTGRVEIDYAANGTIDAVVRIPVAPPKSLAPHESPVPTRGPVPAESLVSPESVVSTGSFASR